MLRFGVGINKRNADPGSATPPVSRSASLPGGLAAPGEVAGKGPGHQTVAPQVAPRSRLGRGRGVRRVASAQILARVMLA
jgi:hypothetical protein